MLLDRVKELSKEKRITIAELERKLDFAQGSISKWNKQSPSSERLQKVADYFDVSADYLLGRTDKRRYFELTEKEKNDIAVQAEELIEGIAHGENLNFYGEPATQEQKDRLMIAIQTAMEMNKREAKEKFTRKDFRD